MKLASIHRGACRCGGDLVLSETAVHDLAAALALLETLDRPLNFGQGQFTRLEMPVTVQQYDCRNSPAFAIARTGAILPGALAFNLATPGAVVVSARPEGCGLTFKQATSGKGRLLHRQGDPGKGIW